jgi:protein-arginine kinase activator protein McsA
MLNWLLGKKCFGCEKRSKNLAGTIIMQADDGAFELSVCNSCADYMDTLHAKNTSAQKNQNSVDI